MPKVRSKSERPSKSNSLARYAKPVAAVHCERAHRGSSDDALILLREQQQVLTESIPLLNGEHEPRF
jgi:hypothetical protein